MELFGEPDVFGALRFTRLRWAGYIFKKNTKQIPKLIFESLPEGIRSIERPNPGGQTKSKNKCEKQDWKRRMLETKKGGRHRVVGEDKYQLGYKRQRQ